ncbi:MAG: uroporphyrinogen-III synthase [Gammaproteobacteria bacterium]|nr:uroporphyrinogen-III synthase [Gammaproteobacteria bacterium]MBT8109682.1 uroporphyrinogen-III synthase [Gammaproteobacteria bacterium]NND46502.1 uroporphyrinogen-III synthase [Woeseiaceae bacterium]NNL44386.1 uroporphyrinogen-III synthase [Woeseiaceae bacterium]
MADAPLRGVGVLVTRPRTQSTELVAAIEAAGGTAFCFPVMEIRALDENVVAANAAGMGEPDIVIFVSRNAVEYGMPYTNDARIAVIGPATAAAVESAGHIVNIQPAQGFDSEHLLAEPELQDVAGKYVRIIRGNDGRELLAEALTARGAIVEYLSVYERRLPDVSAETLADIESRWRGGEITVITVMSVQSLQNLCDLLPRWCRRQLASTPLVTPAARVLKEALDRYPASRPILASGPQASEMVAAIIALHKTEPGLEQ